MKILPKHQETPQVSLVIRILNKATVVKDGPYNSIMQSLAWSNEKQHGKYLYGIIEVTFLPVIFHNDELLQWAYYGNRSEINNTEHPEGNIYFIVLLQYQSSFFCCCCFFFVDLVLCTEDVLRSIWDVTETCRTCRAGNTSSSQEEETNGIIYTNKIFIGDLSVAPIAKI